MKEIIVVTGNKRKVWQAETALSPLGIKVIGKSAPIFEIQTPDNDVNGIEVAKRKAEAAYDVIQKPLIICDQFWSIPALNGFPGPYMKDVDRYLKPEKLLALLEGESDRSIVLYENVVYVDGEITKEFVAKYDATLATEPRGTDVEASGLLIIYEGTDLTIAEHRDRGEHARPMSESAWRLFGEWFSTQK